MNARRLGEYAGGFAIFLLIAWLFSDAIGWKAASGVAGCVNMVCARLTAIAKAKAKL